MKRSLLTCLLALTMIASSAAFRAMALQSESKQGEPKPAPTPTPAHPLAQLRRDFQNSLPFPAGERLEYEVRYSRFPLYVSVGTITFENLGLVPRPAAAVGQNSSGQPDPTAPLIKDLNIGFAPAPGESLWHFRATVLSKGMLISLLGIDVRDRFETLVDMRDFSARLSFKETKEGKKHTALSGLFDRQDQQVKYLNTDLNNPQAAPRAKFLPREDGMLSLLSAFYFVRLQKLKEGEMLRFPVSTDEVNYVFDVIVGKQEKIKTDCGKLKAIKLEPKLLGPGQLISRPGEMFMWVTADNKHIPLRLIAKTSAGTITAKLLNFKNNCRIPDVPEQTERHGSVFRGKRTGRLGDGETGRRGD